jgi:small-conductance mechanosensitive channel
MNPIGFGPAGFDLEAIFRSLTSAQGAVQIACLAAAGFLAWLIARRLRARLPENLSAGFAKIGAGGANRIAFPLLFLILAWLARLILAKFYPVPLLNLAIPLIASYAAIRLAVYLLRHMIPPSAFLKSFERFITFTMWGFAVLYLTGTLSEVLAALEDIKFSVGKDKVTLRQMTEALIYATATVFVALGLSGLAEKRIMSTATINMSLLIAMPLVGIDLTVLSVFGGALGVGLGFGLQKIASNYVSGFIILLDRSVHLGDLVTVDNRHGIVDAIRARYTVLKSFDGTQFIIPNDTLITNVVINHPHADCVIGVKANVTISYDSDLEVATRILLAAAKSHSHVVAAPEPLVLVNRLGENGIELELIAHISDQDQGQAVIRSELLATIWREFRAAGVVIAAPQREVHVIENQAKETQMKHAAASETDANNATRKITS